MRKDVWIFGYGSLLWKVDFPYIDKKRAYVLGWSRRFYQGSTDHRGIPESPGRVVTLIHSQNHRCWGLAYRLPEETLECTLSALDYRERGGYERLEVELFLDSGKKVPGITYFANTTNTNFLGGADPTEIASQILSSRGPSGDNLEYLLCLEKALKTLGIRDPHILDIADAARTMRADQT